MNFTYKNLLFTALAFILLAACSSSKKSTPMNMIATMQVKEPIKGVCDNSKVIAILPFPDNAQIAAKPPLTDEEISAKLNAEVTFLKDKPKYSDQGMVGLVVNCKGKMVRCKIDNKTQSPELDQQIVDVFSKLVDWTAGTVNGKPVDTINLYSFEITDGVIKI